MSLRTKLVLMVVLPMVLIFATLIGTQYSTMRATALREAFDRALLMTAATAQSIDGDLENVMFAADAIAEAITTHEVISEQGLWTLLDHTVEDVPLVAGMSIGWAPGRVPPGQPSAPYAWMRDGRIEHRDLATEYDYTTKEWYTIAASGNWGWTQPYTGPVYGGDIITYSAPMLHDGVFMGVVSVDVPLKPLQELLTIGSFADASAVLVSSEDRYISHPVPELVMKGVGVADEPKLLQEALRNADPGTLHRSPDWPEGVPHLIAFEPVPATDWVLAAALAEAEVLAPVEAHLRWSIGGLVLGCLVITAIVLGLGLRMTAAVRALSSAVSGIAAGDLRSRVERIRRRDELGRLARSFNAMTDRLEETVEREARERGAREFMERELETAREIQAAMLPTECPDTGDLDLHAVNLAARQVGGDFFDWWTRDDTLTCVLADVTGSGVPAALIMVKAMTLLRGHDRRGRDLVDVVTSVNAELCNDNERQMFVTGIVVRIDMTTGVYELVNFGHPSALLGGSDGTVVSEGDSTGPLIGVIPDGVWRSRQGQLPMDGWLALYTDGIIEAADATCAQLGTDPLAQALADVAHEPASVLCQAAVDVAQDWHGGKVDDDLTVLVLRRRASDTV